MKSDTQLIRREIADCFSLLCGPTQLTSLTDLNPSSNLVHHPELAPFFHVERTLYTTENMLIPESRVNLDQHGSVHTDYSRVWTGWWSADEHQTLASLLSKLEYDLRVNPDWRKLPAHSTVLNSNKLTVTLDQATPVGIKAVRYKIIHRY